MQWPKVYAVWHKNGIVRAASRSGGIFTALSDKVLNEGGVVYGCVLTENLDIAHIRAEDATGRNRMRGSKYVQSRLGEAFKDVEVDLKAGRSVLFSGTSCQVAGLRKFLEKVNTDRLLCVDIVCHGVPSPRVWREYLKWQESKSGSKVVAVDFRNKADFGWRDHVETLRLENGEKINSIVFTKLFYGHNVLRLCCYECRWKSTVHPGDITIADYWGIEKAAPEFDDNKGVSLVLINTEKGVDTFEGVKKDLKWKKTRIEDSMQPPLKAPFPKPVERGQFWEDFNGRDFTAIAERHGGYGLVNKLKRGVGKVVRKIKNIIKWMIK